MCRLILGGLSKAFFGYGIADYKGGSGQAEMINNIQVNYKVFDSPAFATLEERSAFASNIEYLKTALAEVRTLDNFQQPAIAASLDPTSTARK